MILVFDMVSFQQLFDEEMFSRHARSNDHQRDFVAESLKSDTAPVARQLLFSSLRTCENVELLVDPV